jgi:hypothetical protein
LQVQRGHEGVAPTSQDGAVPHRRTISQAHVSDHAGRRCNEYVGAQCRRSAVNAHHRSVAAERLHEGEVTHYTAAEAIHCLSRFADHEAEVLAHRHDGCGRHGVHLSLPLVTFALVQIIRLNRHPSEMFSFFLSYDSRLHLSSYDQRTIPPTCLYRTYLGSRTSQR